MALKKKDKQQILSKIEWEGFEYALLWYSHWEQVKDEQFHVLRNNFIKAREELASYIGHIE